MNFTVLHSTLREMRTLARDARSWAVLAALSLIVGLIGPFGTYDMPLIGRLAYWTAVVIITSAIGTLVAGVLERLIGDRLPVLVGAGIAGGLAGLPIVAVVALLNFGVFGLFFQPIDLMTLTVHCVLISAAVTMLGAVLVRHDAGAVATAGQALPSAPALLERLALPQRGRLLHLEVADHYVQVSTDRGKALLLLRLSDAIRETAPVPGLQVHRSHWIALDAVRRTTRQAGKPFLELENGTLVPISRSYLDAARAAGLVG